MQLGTNRQVSGLREVVVATVFFNLVDGVATLGSVYSGFAAEANPLMAGILEVHPVLFMTVKTVLVFCGLLLLWCLRRRPVAVVALFLAFLVYYAVVVYHATVLGLLLAS